MKSLWDKPQWHKDHCWTIVDRLLTMNSLNLQTWDLRETTRSLNSWGARPVKHLEISNTFQNLPKLVKLVIFIFRANMVMIKSNTFSDRIQLNSKWLCLSQRKMNCHNSYHPVIWILVIWRRLWLKMAITKTTWPNKHYDIDQTLTLEHIQKYNRSIIITIYKKKRRSLEHLSRATLALC